MRIGMVRGIAILVTTRKKRSVDLTLSCNETGNDNTERKAVSFFV